MDFGAIPMPRDSAPKDIAVQQLFEPLRGFLVVKRISEFDTKLVVPDTVQDQSQHAVVVSVGPGRVTDTGFKHEMPFAEGDRVFFLHGAGVPLRCGKERFLILDSDQIIGKFPKPAAE